MGIDGQAHDASALEVERDVDSLPIEAIQLGNDIAGGGEEAKWLHGDPISTQPVSQTTL
jgi:hypothetical protein